MWFSTKKLGNVFFKASSIKFVEPRRLWFSKTSRAYLFQNVAEITGDVIIHGQIDEGYPNNRYLDYSGQDITVEVYGYGEHAVIIDN